GRAALVAPGNTGTTARQVTQIGLATAAFVFQPDMTALPSELKRITTFGELLAKHGRGLGCDVCKPAVAGILASCFNEFVLKKEHAGLQDSNDY
ncbi:hypothetical protein SB912_26815, partial [Pantoea sp. SIMBA_072]